MADRPPDTKPLSLRAGLREPLFSVKWTRCKESSDWIASANTVVLNGKLYVGSGRTISRLNHNKAELLVYTPSDDSWEVITTPTYDYSLATYRSQLVLVGGCYPDKHEPTNHIWMLNDTSFVLHPNIPEICVEGNIINVSESPAVGFDNNLLVAVKNSRSVLVFNGEKWLSSADAAIDEFQSQMQSTVHDDEWYLSKENRVYHYSLKSLVANAANPSAHSVYGERLHDLPFADVGIVWFKNHLMALGGASVPLGSHLSQSPVFAYDYEAVTWKHISNFPVPASRQVCCGVLPTGELLVFGGTMTMLNNQTPWPVGMTYTNSHVCRGTFEEYQPVRAGKRSTDTRDYAKREEAWMESFYVDCLDQEPGSSDIISFKWMDKGTEQTFKLRETFCINWRDVGRKFGFSEEMLDVWAATNRENPVHCFDNVIYHWLSDGSNPLEAYPVTWGGLINVLEDVGGVHRRVQKLKTALSNKMDLAAMRSKHKHPEDSQFDLFLSSSGERAISSQLSTGDTSATIKRSRLDDSTQHQPIVSGKRLAGPRSLVKKEEVDGSVSETVIRSAVTPSAGTAGTSKEGLCGQEAVPHESPTSPTPPPNQPVVVEAVALTPPQTPSSTEPAMVAMKPKVLPPPSFPTTACDSTSSEPDLSKEERPSFPLLPTGELTEHQKFALVGRLQKETTKIQREFTSLVFKATDSLEDKIALARFKRFLLDCTFLQHRKGDEKDDENDLQKAKSFDDAFNVIRPFYSFFGYGLIEDIIANFGTDDDKRRLAEYEEHFNEYCKRRVYECPVGALGRTSKEEILLVAKLKKELEKFTLEAAAEFSSKLCEIFNFLDNSLRFVGAEEGCIELHFAVLSSLESVIFPLSNHQRERLQGEGVIVLRGGIHCCNLQDEGEATSEKGSIAVEAQIGSSEVEPEPAMRSKHKHPEDRRTGGLRTFLSSSSVTAVSSQLSTGEESATIKRSRLDDSTQHLPIVSGKKLAGPRNLVKKEEVDGSVSERVIRSAVIPSAGTAGTSKEGLPGVDVIAEIELKVTSAGLSFDWAGYGLKLTFPANCLPPGVKKCLIRIRASTSGQLPDDVTLVSAIYWVETEPSITFEKQFIVEIQNCAKYSNFSQLKLYRTSLSEFPYKFQPLECEVFTDSNSSYTSVQLNQFCGFAVGQEGNHERNCCTSLFYGTLGDTKTKQIDIVISLNLDAYITVVLLEYAERDVLVDQNAVIEFESEEITLEIGEEGVTKDGWKLLPLQSSIKKSNVYNFSPGTTMPRCQLLLRDIEHQNTIFIYKMKMNGAKEPQNYITICSELMSPVTASQKLATRERQQVSFTQSIRNQQLPPEGAINTNEGSAELREELSTIDVEKVAEKVLEWECLAGYLRLEDTDKERIRTSNASNKSVSVIQRWQRRLGSGATFEALVRVANDMGDKSLAEAIVQIANMKGK